MGASRQPLRGCYKAVGPSRYVIRDPTCTRTYSRTVPVHLRAARSPTGAPDRILPEGATCPHGQGEQAQIAASPSVSLLSLSPSAATRRAPAGMENCRG